MIRRVLSDRGGGSAAEFALVLPLLIILLFGVIDVGRWIWVYNEAEKATQMGARMAVVTTNVSSALSNSYIGACSPALTQGDLIPASCFTTITCTNTACTSGTKDPVPFAAVESRMQMFLPELRPANVVIQYSPSGLGYAGNPNGPDISPIVTVSIGSPATPLQFVPLTGFMLASIDMPTFTTSLTAEDLSGTQSN